MSNERAKLRKNKVQSRPLSFEMALASTRFLLPFSMWNRPISPISLNELVRSSCSRTLFSIIYSMPLICYSVLRVSSIFRCFDIRSWNICLDSCSISASMSDNFFWSRPLEDARKGWADCSDCLNSYLVWLLNMDCSFFLRLSLNSMNYLKKVEAFLNFWYRQIAMLFRCSFSVVQLKRTPSTTSLNSPIFKLT